MRVLPVLCVCLVVSTTASAAADEAQTRFRTAAVQRGNVTATVDATGTLEPEEVVDVGAQVAGLVVGFGKDAGGKPIDYGSAVEANTVLARIDPRVYEAQVTQARAALQRADAELKVQEVRIRQAEQDLRRFQRLQGNRTVSADEVEKATVKRDLEQAKLAVSRADVGQAKAALDQARLNLEYCTIRSPVKGVILDRRVNVGQTVIASLNAPSLFLIARDLKKLQIWVAVPEADVGRIKPGQRVTFAVDAFPGDTFAGKVRQVRLNATMAQNVVTYTVVVDTDNSNLKLLPFMTASVGFVVAERKQVLVIPNAALRWRPRPEEVDPADRKALSAGSSERTGSGVVWVPDGEHVRPVQVRLGLSDGRRTEVVGGQLEEGQQVVTGTLPDTRKGARRAGSPSGGLAARLLGRPVFEGFEVQPGTTPLAGYGLGPGGRVTTLTAADADAIARECPEVIAVAPIVRARAQVVHGGRGWIPMHLYGTTPAFLRVRDWEELSEGEPFTDGDVRGHKPVCLIGRTLARELFQGASPLGQYVVLNRGVRLKVIGVLGYKGANPFLGTDEDDILIAPWTTIKYQLQHPTTGAGAAASAESGAAVNALTQLYPGMATGPGGGSPGVTRPRLAGGFDRILVRFTAPDRAQEAKREVREVLRQRHRLRKGGGDDFTMRDALELGRPAATSRP